jgi:hypothetical protein
MTQPKSLLWLATVPKISRENRSLGGLGATAKWPPNHPTFRRALDNNRVVQDPSCPYIYKGRRAEQSTKKRKEEIEKKRKKRAEHKKKHRKQKEKEGREKKGKENPLVLPREEEKLHDSPTILLSPSPVATTATFYLHQL